MDIETKDSQFKPTRHRLNAVYASKAAPDNLYLVGRTSKKKYVFINLRTASVLTESAYDTLEEMDKANTLDFEVKAHIKLD